MLFRRRKKSITDKISIDITREMRDRALDIEFEKSSNILGCNIYYANHLLKHTAILTGKLLETKGFNNSIDNRTEKSVLLATEISELADAVKKGLGVKAEEDEIADIVIRSTNFLCAIESTAQHDLLYQAILEDQKTNKDIRCIAINERSISKSRFEAIEMMMIAWNKINISSRHFEHAVKWEDTESIMSTFAIMWNNIIELTAYCDAYTERYLERNLQDCIASKMIENFKRPYRYNVCDEVDK